MRKIRTMRLATLLLALTLITSCFVGGTFAKYTTSADGEDTARVAYWGFTADADASLTLDLFDADYTDVIAVTNENVQDNVIAPGTGKTATFGFAYTPNAAEGAEAPEVDYSFTVSTDGSEIDEDIKANPNIKWYFDGDLAPAAGAAEAGTWDALLAKIGGLSQEKVTANHLPDSFSENDTVHTVSWIWEFETADDTSTEDINEMAVQDAADTAMGNNNPPA